MGNLSIYEGMTPQTLQYRNNLHTSSPNERITTRVQGMT
jgi:hypothetical protein